MQGGMNFLNKRFVSSHQLPSSLSQSRSSRGLAPSNQYSSSVHNHIISHPQSQLSATPPPPPQPHTNPNALVSNHCNVHSQEFIRHICLDCIELLCAECIGEHISSHKQSNTFPTVQTLKQVKGEMHMKLAQIMQFMFEEKNHPKNISSNIDKIRQESSDKIESLRKELVEYVDEWIGRLKGSVLNNVGYEEVKVIRDEMYGLHEEVNNLNNCLSQNSVSVQTIKKAYQIDAERLQECYKDMLKKYRNLSETMRVDIQVDYQQFLRCLEQSIKIKIGKNQARGVIRVDDEAEDDYSDKNADLPLQISKNNQQELKIEDEEQIEPEAVPFLYHLPSGSKTLYQFQPQGISDNKIYQHLLSDAQCLPLNSVSLLPDSMVVISGGMVSEDKKSDLVQIFDYTDGTLITESKLNKGRSSHQTVPCGEKIFFIGGFTSEDGQCRNVQYLSGEGMTLSPHLSKWGGPNLSMIYKGSLFKVTVSGVQCMDLQSYQWEELLSDVPFTLNKGMQIQSFNNDLYIFGDDSSFYKWNPASKNFQTLKANIKLNPLSSSTVQNKTLYAWGDDQKTLATFDGEIWKIFDDFSR